MTVCSQRHLDHRSVPGEPDGGRLRRFPRQQVTTAVLSKRCEHDVRLSTNITDELEL